MKVSMNILGTIWLTLFGMFVFAQGSAQDFPSETPTEFHRVTDQFNFERREVMIPMRDGVKLHTVILVPKNINKSAILMTRTPYSADNLTTHEDSIHLDANLFGYDNATDIIVEDGYIRVVQDIRGKYESEGEYIMNRPISGPQNPTSIDHATDTYDTIDWLVNNVPECNGRVGILGISYDGFLTLMALVHPHPALKVAIPMNAMVDGWMGDDWFHYGAFRQQMMSYIYKQEATRKNEEGWWSSHYEDYDMFMQAVSAGELGRQKGMEQLGFWRKMIAHPSYDSFWSDQAVDKVLAKQPLSVPVMLVHSLFDAEDIYGTIAVYKAIEPKDTNNDKVFLAMGPWSHGQSIREGSSLGALKFHSDTSLYFRQEILRPFLAQYLIEGAPKASVHPVSAFETGTNKWKFMDSWPIDQEPEPESNRLYLLSGLNLNFTAPQPDSQPYDEYVSDPAKPVPYQTRPTLPIGYGDSSWPRWLVDDQRGPSGRTDVLTFTSATLTEPISLKGQPIANLVASTSGTDSDWVVKLIDVYPDVVPSQHEMGGYQLMISGDIFRGRYREDFAKPKAIEANKPLVYRFALPTTNHVFKPGHRIMVQIQSSWFPLYDRNPQTFVPNIFNAKPEDFKKATQRIFHQPDLASFIELPRVKPE